MHFNRYSIASIIKDNLEKLNFKKPTDIQYKAIPSILNGNEVLAIAQTGTGKTAAFVIPILDLLLKKKANNLYKGVKCLVMVPTRELAIQIEQVFKQIGEGTGLYFLSLIGGVTQDKQIDKIIKGVDVLIATPGRMFDLVNQKYLDLSSVEILVLDEADKMLDKGFSKDIHDVQRLLPYRHQTLFFSATINERIKKMAYEVVKNPIRIQISPKDPVSKNITHGLSFVAMDDKRFFLERIIKNHPQYKILVFVRTKVRAERVLAAMQRLNINSLCIHGNKDQNERLKALNEFKGNTIKVLIATDVSARGIDIPSIDMVINYDLPTNPEDYVHRIGRTGRGVQKGQALSFCSEEEKELLRQIENYINKPISEVVVSNQDYIETIAFSEDIPNTNWQLLIDENEKNSSFKKRKKK